MAVRTEKSFIPLESNPEVFTELIHLLGAPDELSFEDVFTLDEPELLPRPALAVVLVFPCVPASEQRRAAIEASPAVDTTSGGDNPKKPVVWLKQTIHNACGLYAVLHALCNGEAARLIKENSILTRIVLDGQDLPPEERARVLEGSAELEQAHAAVASKGDTVAPESAEDEVDYHYLCFARSDADGCLYELDGDLNGPIRLGPVERGEGGDILGPDTVSIIRRYLDRGGGNIGYHLMALVRRSW